ncbi:MAG TPA: ROK family protein [Lichenihabitans sp.]|jgi:N-acetylglucosamine kinase|nr:ROK family protein [Lichenihabitans sp.]
MLHCFDIGGSMIKGGVARSPRDMTPTRRVATPLHDFDAFAAAIGDIVAAHGGEPDAAAAIAIAGGVDPATHRIACANIPCIAGRDLAGDLGSVLRRRVSVFNDADCFTMAEASLGAGRGHRIVFGAILGTGVGGGIVIDGRLLVGAGGFAGEWGHGPVAATTAGTPPTAIPRFPCGCGQSGCVDTVGGARGLERLHRHLHGEALASPAIIEAWRTGGGKAARTVDCFVDLVASPLALAVNLVGASIVPLGGGLAHVPALVDALDAAVRARILRWTSAPLVVQGQCRIEPGLIGAGLLGIAESAA